MFQLTSNCQCSVVHVLPIEKSAKGTERATTMISIDYQCANQLPSVFISAGYAGYVLWSKHIPDRIILYTA